MKCRFLIPMVPVLLIVTACVSTQSPPDNGSAVDHLAPGLHTVYFDGKYRNVRQLPEGLLAYTANRRPGADIAQIDHQFGNNEVFDSGRSREVGVRITGYIYLEDKGSYAFQALSNDGVELKIDDRSILVDPDVHSDRLSPIGTVTVEKTGWYPLLVDYFQRKGTAALRLYWKPPGQETFAIVPASAYGHIPTAPGEK